VIDPIAYLDFPAPGGETRPAGGSICPYCRGPLEHHANHRSETLQGEYHEYEADIIEHIFICVSCWKRWPGKETA